MNKKMFNGILSATPEKRYNHFLNVASDTESVYMVDCGDDNLLSPEINNIIYYLAWSEKEFAEYYLSKMYPKMKCQIVTLEIHEFCDIIKNNQVMFMIFPTDKDTWIVSSDDLYENLAFELSRIE